MAVETGGLVGGTDCGINGSLWRRLRPIAMLVERRSTAISSSESGDFERRSAAMTTRAISGIGDVGGEEEVALPD